MSNLFKYEIMQGNVLHVNLPGTLIFNLDFMNSTTELIERVLDELSMAVVVSCSTGAQYDKMTKAYILIILKYLATLTSIKWNKNLSEMISPSIHMRAGSGFPKINLIDTLTEANALDYYKFRDGQMVSELVNEMANILVDKNMTINEKEVKEFLSTTIGEVFSNCFLHSNQDEALFMYDILTENDDFYLCVSIIDFGTTIVGNVQEFFMLTDKDVPDSKECLNWAMKKGTTTRRGSGGYGLATLIEYVETANGELSIFSGDVFYSLKNRNIRIDKSLGRFDGTSVVLKAKLFELSQVIKYDTDKNKLVSIRLEDI